MKISLESLVNESRIDALAKVSIRCSLQNKNKIGFLLQEILETQESDP